MNADNEVALKALYARIEELYRHFRDIRTEAAGIAQTNQMPDATLHLNDVLQATEDATITIIDATGLISACVGDPRMPQDLRERIGDQVGRIYEACGFQDISGQRIKKVLQHLTELESQLHNLAQAAHVHTQDKPKDSLMNGPALSAAAPSQAEIDSMFASANTN